MSFDHLFILLVSCFALLMLALIALLGFSMWIGALKRARLVEDMATSTARSVAQGYVELIGIQHCVPGQEIAAPLTGKPCTWWHYKIEEYRRSLADGGRRTHRVVIEQATSTDMIVFKDATGQLLVNPEGAEVEPSTTQCWGSDELLSRPMVVGKFRRARYIYTEKRMHAGCRMYVAGKLCTFDGHRQAEAHNEALSDRLGQWKQDQAGLLERFDTDRNGRIDMAEWDAARAAASAEVSAQLESRSVQPQVDVLCKPSDGQPFLVSAKRQSELAGKQRFNAFDGFFLFVFGVGWMLYLVHHWWF